MKQNKNLYQFIRKIHLYTSLITVAFLVMYILTSYMFMYHDFFKLGEKSESSISVKVQSIDWTSLLKKHDIKGRLIRENLKENGDVERIYASAKGSWKLNYYKGKNEVEILTTRSNLPGNLTGIHRLRGYGGSLLYNLYALMLDIVGVSLVLFAVTGVILWLQLLKQNKMAWIIFILGFIYVSAVVTYLLYM